MCEHCKTGDLGQWERKHQVMLSSDYLWPIKLGYLAPDGTDTSILGHKKVPKS